MSLVDQITIGCAVVSSAMAVAQFGAAWVTLKAARQIAADQKAEADRIRYEGQRHFVDAVVSLGQEALSEAERAETVLRAGAGASGILYNFGQRLADLHEALQPIRHASPPDAALMLAVGRLSRALVVPPPEGVDGEIAIRIVNQHRGSIGIELGRIGSFEIDEPATAPTRRKIGRGAPPEPG